MTGFIGTERASRESPWVGEHRDGWFPQRLKWTVESSTNGIWGDEATGGDDDVICYRVADFDREALRIKNHDLTVRAIPRSARASRLLHPGDLLLEKSGGGERQLVGVVVIHEHPEPAVCSNFVARLRVQERYDSRFLTYLHARLYYARVNARSIKQTTGIQNLDQQLYLDEVVLVPPLGTQKAIAAFLDRKTAAIDALIEKKQKLLDLLAEKRAALINQAVTKGLDPNVPMKDSGIPWIGEIPAHWEVMRLRHISPKQTVGVVVNPSSYVEDNGDVPFIYGSEVSEGSIDVSQARRISHTSNKLLAKTQLREGDLVSVRVGDPGITAVVPPELDGMNCGSIMIVRRSSSFDSQWLTYVMNSKAGRQNVWLVAYGAAQKQYNIGHAVDFLYPVPPLGEQRQIADWLALSTVKIDRLSTWLEETVRRLQEYRQALITAAVTGQVEIR